MEWLSDPEAWSALAALVTLGVVLGVNNDVVISILAAMLPEDQQGEPVDLDTKLEPTDDMLV